MEKPDILKLAQRKAGAWECRRLLACEVGGVRQPGKLSLRG
jgi:hypothetical protein